MRRRRGIPDVEEFYETCSGANDGPWRQGEVLQGSRVQLENGLNRTKEQPTSVPTTPPESSFIRCRSARAGGKLENVCEPVLVGSPARQVQPDDRSGPGAARHIGRPGGAAPSSYGGPAIAATRPVALAHPPAAAVWAARAGEAQAAVRSASMGSRPNSIRRSKCVEWKNG